MYTFKRLTLGSLFVFILAGTAVAQDNRAPVDNPPAPVSAGPLVTATASAKRVRFVSPGTVVQLRLEVYNEAGQKLFDTEVHGGNVLDWLLQDGAGQRLPPGSYACVLTIKSLSGRLSQRVGLVTVNDKKAAIETAGGLQLSLAQQQTIGPVESSAAFTVLQQSEAEAITTVTHDGSDGQMARSRGALSFRVGDLFSGNDQEQMRLTEEGNLGIGTGKPEAKLDVAGTVRAREGFAFSDGSTLNVNDKGALTLTNSNGTIAPSISGTGTQNRLAKWTDNAGTLGDSVAIDTGTALQLTVAPSQVTDTNLIYLNSTNGTTGMLAGSNPSYGAANGPFFAMRGNAYTTFPGQRGLFTIGAGNVSSPAGDDGSVKFNTGNDFLRMVIRPSGNVGIGTPSPGALLDVAGHINTSTQYNIGGSRVLTTSSFSGNIFAGNGAGASNGLGSDNSFFGLSAGQSNVTGGNNSFFGKSAGINNTAGNNSFFGEQSGFGNSSGQNNSAFGQGSGRNNGTGSDNASFGYRAGFNATGSGNSFFGSQAGDSVTSGLNNAFFGYKAGATANVASHNSFFGYNAGTLTTSGSNSFFGASAGAANTSGSANSFFGMLAGHQNTTGNSNAFFGTNAGGENTTGSGNSFFGAAAGEANTSGFSNSFFGRRAGEANTTGEANSFFGTTAGADNTTGTGNSFFGVDAGADNTTGTSNSFFGSEAGSLNISGPRNTYFGYGAGRFGVAGRDNTLVGYVAGDNSTGSDNTFVGSDAGGSNTSGYTNTFVGRNAGDANTTGDSNTIIGANADVASGALTFATAIGAGAVVDRSNAIVLGRSNDDVIIPGTLEITVAQGGTYPLCFVPHGINFTPTTCSSSLRYKTNLAPFRSGLSFINQLRPISYDWKKGGMKDVGFGAEDVEKIDPRFVTFNKTGEVEGVRYDHLSTVFVNAFKEQQTQIEQQQRQIDQLKQIVCRFKRGAAVCRKTNK